MIHQLDIGDWLANGSEVAICRLPLTLAQVAQRHGLSFTPCGPARPGQWQAVIGHEGQVYLLQAARDALPPDSLVEVIARGDVRDPQALVPKICSAFGLAPEALAWLSPELGARPWALWRLDDNNQRSAMFYFSDRSQAERLAKIYTARGHKQLYEVDQALPAAAPDP